MITTRKPNTLEAFDDHESENRELKREIEKMRTVIEAQAKKIKTKSKINNSGYYPGGLDAYMAANSEQQRQSVIVP